MTKFQIWCEGHMATGESSTAHLMGEYEGETFMDAYREMVKKIYGDSPPEYVHMDEPIIWGCQHYDNEADARRSFG